MKYWVLYVHAFSGHVVAKSFQSYFAYSCWESYLVDSGYNKVLKGIELFQRSETHGWNQSKN
jgi:hypothetical protein